jgi:uncharacterized SAM-binding protein YcdF (DUF218 family)
MELSPFLFGAYKLAKYALYPLSWVLGLLAVITILAYRRPSPRRLRYLRILAAATLILALVVANPFVGRTLLALIEMQAPAFDPDAESRRFDAIVVLGGGMYPKGSLRPTDELSYYSLTRTACAAELYARGFAPKIVITGGDATIFGEATPEALEMKRFAMRLGVPADAILIDDLSRTTYENALGVKRLLGPASILLSTSAFHIWRADALFRRQGFAVTPYPCAYLGWNKPGELAGFSPLDLLPTANGLLHSTYAINEMAGMTVYRLLGKL